MRWIVVAGLGLSTGCLWHSTAPEGGSKPLQPLPPLVRAEVPPVIEPKPYKPDVRPALSLEVEEKKPDPPQPELPPPPSMPPLPKDKPLVAAFRHVLEKHPEEAARELEKAGAKRERLLALLKLTAGVSEGEIEKLPPGEAAALLDHLREMSRAVSKHAPLELKRLAYCRSIRGFGQYEAASSPSYEAGEAVQVYAEVANFGSRAMKDGHETRLAATVEVRSAEGKRVGAVPLGECLDKCGSLRQDYFLNCRFQVPAGLAAGEYVLWVTVKDATEGKPREAKASLPFKVSAKGS